MKKLILVSILFFVSFVSISQSDSSGYKGTIKVQKKGAIVTVIYDEVNFRLIGKDQYGNILDSCVVQFRVKTTIKGIAYDELTNGNFLSKQMQVRLSRLDGSTTLFFSEILVSDKYGNKYKWNDLKINLGNAIEREY